MRTFLMAALAAFAIGCTASPELDSEVDDTSQEVEEEAEEESPITWEDCGGALGVHACDFTFKDQTDTEWNLYNHYGSIMVVDFSVIWCGPCQSAASNVAAHMTKYANDDVIWVTVLIQDEDGNRDVDLADVQLWANTYGVPATSPVLQGDYTVVDPSGENGYPVVSYPTIVVVDREMVIYAGIHGWSQSMVEGWVDELLEN